MSPERLAELKTKVDAHTSQCGPCDYGLVEFGCSCAGDPRPLLLELLRELEEACRHTPLAMLAEVTSPPVDSGHTPG